MAPGLGRKRKPRAKVHGEGRMTSSERGMSNASRSGGPRNHGTRSAVGEMLRGQC